jgi:hypothetical protein
MVRKPVAAGGAVAKMVVIVLPLHPLAEMVVMVLPLRATAEMMVMVLPLHSMTEMVVMVLPRLRARTEQKHGRDCDR